MQVYTVGRLSSRLALWRTRRQLATTLALLHKLLLEGAMCRPGFGERGRGRMTESRPSVTLPLGPFGTGTKNEHMLPNPGNSDERKDVRHLIAVVADLQKFVTLIARSHQSFAGVESALLELTAHNRRQRDAQQRRDHQRTHPDTAIHSLLPAATSLVQQCY